jgi:hypothetical protein
VQGRAWSFDPAVIKAPTRILHREPDMFVPIAHGHHTAELISGSTLVTFPDMGTSASSPRSPFAHRRSGGFTALTHAPLRVPSEKCALPRSRHRGGTPNTIGSDPRSCLTPSSSTNRYSQTPAPRAAVPAVLTRAFGGVLTAPMHAVGTPNCRTGSVIIRRCAFAWSGRPSVPCFTSSERAPTGTGGGLPTF